MDHSVMPKITTGDSHINIGWIRKVLTSIKVLKLMEGWNRKDALKEVSSLCNAWVCSI